eukprot:1357343-Alexandrium_andersonii.AAC.1
MSSPEARRGWQVRPVKDRSLLRQQSVPRRRPHRAPSGRQRRPRGETSAGSPAPVSCTHLTLPTICSV